MERDLEILNIKIFDIKTQKAINLKLEDYVESATAFAISPKFPKEALKAQAICSRTLAIKHMGVFGGVGCKKHPSYDMCTDFTHCQGIMSIKEREKQWGNNFTEYNNRIKAAVLATKDEILVYNDNPIEAVFHTACGGFTEDSENVWKNKISYLRRVECDYCKNSPYKTLQTYTLEELEKYLGIKFESKPQCKIPGIVNHFVKTPAQRIKEIHFGNKSFEGEEVKNLLKFPSTRFFWELPGLVFEIIGFGHGLGLCQYGAKEMALEGFTAEDILKFYFTGVKIKTIEKPTYCKPLMGRKIVLDPGQGGSNSPKGPMGISEGYVNLEIVKSLQEKLEEKGAKILLTREEDKFMSLAERADFSNSHKPNLTISINQNFYPSQNAEGTEVFYYPSDEEAGKLSFYIHKNLVKTLALKDLGVKAADLYLVRETNNPSVWINVAFLTNPKEERLLSEKQFRDKAAEAIAQGIIDYYGNLGAK